MEFEKCKIIRRLNKFVVEVFIDGEVQKAAINNTGKLSQYLINGMMGFCTLSRGRYKYRLFSILEDDKGVLIDTKMQEEKFLEIFEEIDFLKGAKLKKRNVKVGNSKIDFLFEKNGEKIYVELKSAVMRNGNCALYPDTRSIRAERQVKDLLKIKDKKAIVFVCGIPKVKYFRINNLVAPEFFRLIKENKENLILYAIGMYFDPRGEKIKVYNNIEVNLEELKFENLKVVEKAIEEYNKRKAPEVIARLIEFYDKTFKVEFRGWRTCGLYDNFEDLIFIFEDLGFRVRILDFEGELPAVVTYKFIN